MSTWQSEEPEPPRYGHFRNPASKDARRLLNDLYVLARRQVMGVEKALDAILKELGSDDEDIPF